MARYCHVDIDTVYERHGQVRRQHSEERKEQLREQLARAREVKRCSSQ
jgi:hypothetical protein